MASGGSVTIKVLLDTSEFKSGVDKAKSSLAGMGKSDPTKPLQTGFTQATSKVNLLSRAATACQNGLKKIGTTVLSFGTKAVGAIGGVAAALGGLTIAGGISRAMGINEARAKMNQLGMDTEEVMENVDASVTGTKYALNDMASVAVAMSASGVAAGEDMTNSLKSIASTASISGAELSEIGTIYAKVAASGKLNSEVMTQLLERGISVTAALSKALGKTQDEVKEMVSNGEVDFKTFSDAMYAYLGDASMSANTTFSGAMANVRAALSRVGAAFADPALEALRQIFVPTIDEIKALKVALEPLAGEFTEFCNAHVGPATEMVKNFVGGIKGVVEAVATFGKSLFGSIDFEGFKSAFAGIGDALARVFGGDTQTQATNFGTVVAGLINGLIPIIQMATPIIETLANVFKFVAENAQILIPVILTVMGIIAGLGLIQNVAGFFNSFGTAVATATPKLQMNAVQMMQLGVAALAVGGGIALACAGIYLLVQAAIQLAGAGPMAALALVGLVAVLGGFIAVMALLGPALTAGAVGMVAFGAAILLVGAGVLLACVGLSMLAATLPMIMMFGPGAAMGIAAIGAAVLVATPGLLLFSVALVAFGVAAFAAGAGAMILGAGLMIVGAAVLIAAVGMLLLSASLPIIAASGASAAAGMLALSGAMLAASPGAIALGASCLLLAAGAAAAGAAMLVLAAGAMASGIGLLLCSAPATLLAASMPMAAAGAALMGAALLIIAASSLAALPGMLALAAGIGGVALALGLATPAFAGLAGALGGAAGSLASCQASMAACSAMALLISASCLVAGNSARSMGPAFLAAATQMQSATQRMNRALADLSQNVKRQVAEIEAAFKGMKLEIPSPTLGKMPHFRMTGNFDPQTGAVPTISVDWYAKGGYATKATVLGGIGMGEAGGEGIVPLQGRHMYPMADAVAQRMSSGTGNAELLDEVRGLRRELPRLMADCCDIKMILSDREFGIAVRNAKKQGWLDK